MKDWIAAGLAASMLFLLFGPLLFARHMTVRAHKEQFKATGGAEFELPSWRSFEEGEPAARPEPEEKVFPNYAATATQEIHARTLLSTETGEIVRLGPDGLPLSEADIAARTAPTTFTIDTERLAEVLSMEATGEYPLTAATWAEIGAAEVFMKDPLGANVLPPIPLAEEAGNPALAATFYAVLAQGGLTTDWADEDSEFHFWDVDLPLGASV